MSTIKIKSIPSRMTIHDYVDQYVTKFNTFGRAVTAPSKDYGTFLKFKLPEDLNFELLVEDTKLAMEKYGAWNYRLNGGEGDRKDQSYGGIGLTYNTGYIDGDIHEQIQGTHTPGTADNVSNPYSLLSGEDMPRNKRNTHYDTYGFVHRTPASRVGELGRFIDTFKRPMVRTAVRIIYAENEGPVGDDKFAGVTWHIDERMPINLRVNIPLVTHPDYVLEQQGFPPVHLEQGHAYTWDTNLLHRAYAQTRTAPPRIHLMLGFSCWWDFNEATQSWASNKFTGRKHPLDMLVDGDVIPGLQLI
jgi:hypothetical protein